MRSVNFRGLYFSEKGKLFQGFGKEKGNRRIGEIYKNRKIGF